MPLPDPTGFAAWLEVLKPAGAILGLLALVWGWMERRRAEAEREAVRQLQERLAALAVDLQVTMAKLQGALVAIKESIDSMR